MRDTQPWFTWMDLKREMDSTPWNTVMFTFNNNRRKRMTAHHKVTMIENVTFELVSCISVFSQFDTTGGSYLIQRVFYFEIRLYSLLPEVDKIHLKFIEKYNNV